MLSQSPPSGTVFVSSRRRRLAPPAPVVPDFDDGLQQEQIEVEIEPVEIIPDFVEPPTPEPVEFEIIPVEIEMAAPAPPPRIHEPEYEVIPVQII